MKGERDFIGGKGLKLHLSGREEGDSNRTHSQRSYYLPALLLYSKPPVKFPLHTSLTGYENIPLGRRCIVRYSLGKREYLEKRGVDCFVRIL